MTAAINTPPGHVVLAGAVVGGISGLGALGFHLTTAAPAPTAVKNALSMGGRHGLAAALLAADYMVLTNMEKPEGWYNGAITGGIVGGAMLGGTTMGLWKLVGKDILPAILEKPAAAFPMSTKAILTGGMLAAGAGLLVGMVVGAAIGGSNNPATERRSS